MPKADATGLAPEKSAEQNPPALSSAPEGFLLCAASPISMVKSRSGGLGHSNAKTARRALQILRLLGPGGIPPKPIAKLRNSPGNNVRISGGKSVTRYIKFLTNNFTLPALTIALIYKSRWQVELFFKWIKPHLRIKAFYGTSENAVKTQIWIAVSVYVLVAIVRKRLGLDASLYQILQIFSVTLFEKTPILQVFQEGISETDLPADPNQWILFDL